MLGFFDHVSPPSVITAPPPKAAFTTPFESLGVRVPAFVISPFVKPGTVYSGDLDHTSILKFVAQVFGDGSYNPEVDQRSVGNVSNVSSGLTDFALRLRPNVKRVRTRRLQGLDPGETDL